LQSSSLQVRDRFADAWMREFEMLDRHLLGDAAIAIVLAVPTLAMARPQPTVPAQTQHATALVQHAVAAEATATHRRYTIPQ
jgi:hypothetical protein